MALLDNLIASVVSAVAGEKAPALNDFLKTNGGIAGLAEKFQNGGAGEMFASWVGTDKNEPITSEQITKVLGNSQLQEIATKLGIDTTAATEFIATNLPVLIDKLTPDGKVEANPAATEEHSPRPQTPKKASGVFLIRALGGACGLTAPAAGRGGRRA
jgi:uncharacterized protein YidB (DUF937 family)